MNQCVIFANKSSLQGSQSPGSKAGLNSMAPTLLTDCLPASVSQGDMPWARKFFSRWFLPQKEEEPAKSRLSGWAPGRELWDPGPADGAGDLEALDQEAGGGLGSVDGAWSCRDPGGEMWGGGGGTKQEASRYGRGSQACRNQATRQCPETVSSA